MNETLSAWEISFRWAGYDPEGVWLRLPLAVRDHLRTMMDEIHQGHLDCLSLQMEKWDPKSDTPPEFYIRHHLDDILACVEGRRYPRKLFRWAGIDRDAMQDWCERRNIPLPEFWFQPGVTDYRWSDEEAAPAEPVEEATTTDTDEKKEERQTRLDRRQRARIACQEIARHIWAAEPNLTIKDVANRPEVQTLGGGESFGIEAVRDWLGKVDPRSPTKKRGRRRKNNSAEDPPTAT